MQKPRQLPSNYHDSIMHQLPHTTVAKYAEELGCTKLAPGNGPSHPDPLALQKFCNKHGVATAAVDLDVGDAYLFKADSVHQVPGFKHGCRVVLASFIGFSENEPEMAWWS